MPDSNTNLAITEQRERVQSSVFDRSPVCPPLINKLYLGLTNNVQTVILLLLSVSERIGE